HSASRAATVQGHRGRAGQQDGADRQGVAGQGWDLPGAPTRGSLTRARQWEDEVGPAFTNCRGEDDIDAKRSRPSIGKARKVPREKRTRVFAWDPISGSHQGSGQSSLQLASVPMVSPSA